MDGCAPFAPKSRQRPRFRAGSPVLPAVCARDVTSRWLLRLPTAGDGKEPPPSSSPGRNGLRFRNGHWSPRLGLLSVPSAFPAVPRAAPARARVSAGDAATPRLCGGGRPLLSRGAHALSGRRPAFDSGRAGQQGGHPARSLVQPGLPPPGGPARRSSETRSLSRAQHDGPSSASVWVPGPAHLPAWAPTSACRAPTVRAHAGNSPPQSTGPLSRDTFHTCPQPADACQGRFLSFERWIRLLAS